MIATLYFKLLVLFDLFFWFEQDAIWFLKPVDAIHTDPLLPWQTVWSLHPQQSLLNQTWVENQQEECLQHLLANVNPVGTRRGFIAASPSKVNPNYFYTWTRDASLISYVVATLLDQRQKLSHYTTNLASKMDLNQVLYDYVDFQIHTQHTVDRTPCQCLGEPKFNADGSPFVNIWGRPQNDGPAERTIAMIQFANVLVERNTDTTPLDYIRTTLKPSIYLDLDYVVRSWKEPCFDLWEEIKGIHFYTLMVMRRGLLDGSDFALKHDDSKRVHLYRHFARRIEQRLLSFWSSSDNYIKVTQDQVQGQQKPSGLDISILLAANLAAPLKDGFFTPESDKILATAKALEDAFANLYPLNTNKQDDDKAATAMGRYPEDRYDGYGLSIGNPWFLATTAMAELYYLAMMAWQHQGGVEVTNINHGFFKERDSTVEVGHFYKVDHPDFDALRHSLASDADRFLLTVQHHQGLDGALSEQYNRDTGFLQGAPHLTWSYASLISTLQIRDQFYSSLDS
ncbi:unnamed protein product [Absidia cylindrospora]